MNRKRTISSIAVSAVLIFLAGLLAGCDSASKHSPSPEALKMLTDTYRQKDYNRIMTLADSLEEAGAISQADCYYWQGFAFYLLKQRRAAEFYWKESINAAENYTDSASLATYAKSASFLTGMLIRYLSFTSALKIVKPALEHLDKHHATTSSDYTNLLIFEGCCLVHFNVQGNEAHELFERAYKLHMDHINAGHSKDSYSDAVVGFINIAYGLFNKKRYAQALVWTERLGKLLEEYKQRFGGDDAYFDKQWARYTIFSAICLEGTGKQKEAATAYSAFQKTRFANTVEGQLDASDYLSMTGRWGEAADNLFSLDGLFADEQAGTSLEDIHRHLLRKYNANVMAGRRDSALTVANQICERLDSAIIKSQLIDSEEQEMIRQKEEQILQQQERLSKNRIMALISTVIVLIIFFVVFTTIRHQAAKRMAKLQAAKERMESELQIARDIQMSMVPNSFPEVDGLDMYASMTPAKEVGGDLYGYLLQDDMLYFALGDVSGKGVPASLFMSQATRLFLTLSKQGMMPAEICTRMNDALSGEDNVKSMFVTMFVGLLDLKTGHLDFCNAGHNSPVLGGETDKWSFIEMEPNAPIGLWPGLEYVGEEIDSIRGRVLFVYTDGLNEAENQQQEQFGDDRLLELIQNTHFDSSRQLIDTFVAEVETFRDGAEPNDDLTMLCLRLNK